MHMSMCFLYTSCSFSRVAVLTLHPCPCLVVFVQSRLIRAMNERPRWDSFVQKWRTCVRGCDWDGDQVDDDAELVEGTPDGPACYNALSETVSSSLDATDK